MEKTFVQSMRRGKRQNLPKERATSQKPLSITRKQMSTVKLPSWQNLKGTSSSLMTCMRRQEIFTSDTANLLPITIALYQQAHFYEDAIRLASSTEDPNQVQQIYLRGVTYFEEEQERLRKIGDNHHLLLRAARLAEIIGDHAAAEQFRQRDQQSIDELLQR